MSEGKDPRGRPVKPRPANWLRIESLRMIGEYGGRAIWGVYDASGPVIGWRWFYTDAGRIKSPRLNAELSREASIYLGQAGLDITISRKP